MKIIQFDQIKHSRIVYTAVECEEGSDFMFSAISNVITLLSNGNRELVSNDGMSTGLNKRV